jgi:iron complex transport system ATP-binding protein
MQNIIEIKHVAAYRGSTRVFSDLSLDIARRCNTAILGPNGAGKSTLLKLLSREIYPVNRAGSSIRVFGQERQIMATLGVAGLRNRPFGAMSTGEQRRFLLGRALINDPDTLLLDEPTSGLDLNACFQYLDIVRGLMQAGKTIILVTHHIHEIPPEVSRVVLLKQGAVIADGEKSTILSSAQLSDLFDTPIELVRANGFYQALPGGH